MSESSPPTDQDHQQPGNGVEDHDPGSKASEEPLPDSRVNDSLDAPDLEKPSESTIRVASAQSLAGRQTAAIARVVAENLGDLELGKYLPDDMPRDRREMLIKAEALWLSGVSTPADIAKVAGKSTATVYAWASMYGWKKRADIAQLGQDALRQANMVAIATRARAAVDEARAQAAGSSVEIKPKSSARVDDPDVVDFLTVRDGRPMSEVDAQRAALIEQAVADAQQSTILSLFVDAISKIVDQQQQVSNQLVGWGAEMLQDLMNAYQVEKGTDGKKVTAKEVRDRVAKNLPMYRQLVAALAQSIAMQRRTWMIADAGRAGSAGDGDGFASDWGGIESSSAGTTAPGVAVAVQRGSYEDSIRHAEAQGIDLTKRGPAA